MKIRRTILWITMLLPIAVAVLAYGRLPDIIPIHWNINGNVDGTAPRPMILCLAFIGIIMTAIIFISAKRDPNFNNMSQKKIYYEICSVANLMVLAVMYCTVSEALHPGSVDVGRIVTFLAGILYVLIGNKMPKIRQNRYMGIKTKYTLDDKATWNYTSRIGGRITFAGGIIIMLSAFVLPPVPRVITLFAVIILSIFIIYFLSRKFAKSRK